jgi:hypothetical protein
VVTVSSAFSEAPNAQSIWIIQDTGLQTQQFRIISVAEAEDGIYGCTALAYNSSIYAAIESDIKLTTRDITNLSALPQSPTSLTGVEHLYTDGQNVRTAFELSWLPPLQLVQSYRVIYRLNNNNWSEIETNSPSTRIEGLDAGTLQIKVQSINSLGGVSSPATATFNLVGKTAVPGNVENLTIETISANSARLRWDPTVDLDVKVGGRVHIRHTNLTDGTGTWSNSVDLIPAKAGVSTEAIVPLVEGEILVKFEDDGGRQSPTEASVIVDFPDALGNLLVQSRREDADSPPYQGTKTDVFYSDEFDALVLDGDTLLDAVADFDLIASFDYLGATEVLGTYQFASAVDLGAVFSLDLSRFFVTAGFFPNDAIDSRTAEVDSWSDWDGGIIDQVNAKLYLRRTPDNPASSPTWSSWQEFVNGTFLGRGFQFKAELSSSNPAQNILIDQLGYEATFQRRTEQSVVALASGAATYAVTFTKPFFTGTALLGGLNTSLPSIGITAQNLSQGDFFNVTNVTSTGFDVIFRNSAGTAVSRNFLWSAVGFGKGA